MNIENDDSQPPEFRDLVEQIDCWDEERQVNHVHIEEVKTGLDDLGDVTSEEWRAMSDEEREEAEDWLARLHDARVAIAGMSPDDRALIDEFIGSSDNYDEYHDPARPEVLERAIAELERHRAA